VSHFPSKLYWDDDSQAAESVVLAEEVERAEAQVGHQQTVLVGDLNMNPFESGLVSAKGLHAVMSRDVAAKGYRMVQNKSYQFFYNPMWSFFGDASIGPPGTYYYSDSSHKIFFWNMFDQVLVRPSLLNFFSNEEVRILESDGVNSLLSSTGLPNADAASDHLPIMFAINL
jgi:hypothetical protein